nr:MAG TPA: protein of unknown function (DUF3173) [Caudoviricetes sp.]
MGYPFFSTFFCFFVDFFLGYPYYGNRRCLF